MTRTTVSRTWVAMGGNGQDNNFYTQVNGKRADVGVVSDEHGKYLRTHADGYYNDNLLALPECIGN
jgi:hypothetical protein